MARGAGGRPRRRLPPIAALDAGISVALPGDELLARFAHLLSPPALAVCFVDTCHAAALAPLIPEPLRQRAASPLLTPARTAGGVKVPSGATCEPPPTADGLAAADHRYRMAIESVIACTSRRGAGPHPRWSPGRPRNSGGAVISPGLLGLALSLVTTPAELDPLVDRWIGLEYAKLKGNDTGGAEGVDDLGDCP